MILRIGHLELHNNDTILNKDKILSKLNKKDRTNFF